ncbi:MAG: hypothetical protein AB8C02_19450 [Halioglobus sp.]
MLQISAKHQHTVVIDGWRLKTFLYIFIAAALAGVLAGCEDGEDTSPQTVAEQTPTPAQVLLTQFGAAQQFFSEAGLEALIELDSSGMPVTLLQLHSVADPQAFASYENAIASVWQTAGAQPRFSSQAFGQLIGERSLSEFRAVTFPSAMILVESFRTDEFTIAMNGLAAATDDIAWVLGVEDTLPPAPTAGYVDPALQNLSQDDVESLLATASQDSTLGANTSLIPQMLLSDDPSPFWMVNLINYYDQAMYPDGRDSDLTGLEANAIYGQSILPSLLAYNSFPELVMPISVNLTKEPADWETAAIVRYASRDAFLRIFPLNPRVSENVIHKEASVAQTIVYPSAIADESLPTPENGPFYNFRYCEVLLGAFNGERLQADVYNSIGFSDCPQPLWDALDADAIAQSYAADVVALNGIRFWVLDGIAATLPAGERILEDFGGITMRLAASANIPFNQATADTSYVVTEVSRDTVFTYVAGRQVYELTDPDGERYMMQSFSRVVDKEQKLGDLQFLNRRLNLPSGWQFSTRVLRDDFQLRTVDGIARVVPDDLNNVYQRVP